MTVPPSGGRRLPVDVDVPDRRGSYRCSDASRLRDEPLTATASTVAAFLLLEEPGPWGPAMLRCLRVPEEVQERARVWERELGLRPLLVRRPERSGRAAGAPRRVFVVNARHGWAETALVASLDEVARWDLTGVRGPEGVGLDRHTQPLLLVCTHGRHDACCAERGRPVATALAARWPEEVWESSHLGGDRFAPNLLVLPGGHTYGRLDPAEAVDVVARHLAGRIDLDRHRGRTVVPWVAQAAEAAVRARLGETDVDAMSSHVLRRDPVGADVVVRVRGQALTVRVDVEANAPARLTCTAPGPVAAPAYRVSVAGWHDGQ